MNKAITIMLGLIILSAAGFAQQRTDEMEARFDKIRTELELTKEQEMAIKEVFDERRSKLNAQESRSIETKEEAKERRMEEMKARKTANQEFKSKLTEILNEDQMAKFEEMTEDRKEKMKMKRHEHKPTKMHQHKNGEKHSH